MKDNMFSIGLKITLLIIFVFSSITDVMPAERSALSYPALRPLAYRRSGLRPILPDDTRKGRQKSGGGERESGELSDEERLQEAELLYKENNLNKIGEASDILLDYIYSGDGRLRQRAEAILERRDNLFVINQKPERRHSHGSTDYTPGTIPTKENFDNITRAGGTAPLVIVNIKKAYPRIELACAAEMRRISSYYNGNVTFILKVEELTPPADLPGATKTLYDTMEILGDDAFKNTFTIQIPAGGFKTRLGSMSLRYANEILVPYYRDTSELQEVFSRAGRMLMQMPNKGVGDHIICACDTLPEPGAFHLDRSVNRGLQVSAVRRPKTILDRDLDGPFFLFIDGRPEGRIDDIGPKKAKEILREHKTAFINELPHLVVWNKTLLSEYMRLAYQADMEDGRPLVHAPINLHKDFTRSVFHTAEAWEGSYQEWKRMNPPDITNTMQLKDWMKVRELALNILGEKAERVNFVQGKARDEGKFGQLMARFRKPPRHLNRVKRDPGIMLGNATGARLDHVIFRGKGTVIFGGPNVRLRNAIIELEEGEILYIPDGWIIKDSYIGKNEFEEGGGLLTGATLYKDDMLHPLRNKRIKADACSSVISRIDEEPLFISARFDEPTTICAGRRKYEFRQLQREVDAAENWRALYLLQETIHQEFEGIPPAFPLSPEACAGQITRPAEKRIYELAAEVIRGQEERGGGQYDVYIEGIQGTDKVRFAKKLAKSLRKQGKEVVLLHEGWYRKSGQEIEKLHKENPREWRRHYANWHRWDKLSKDLGMIWRTKKGRVTLKNLYRESTDRCDLRKAVDITPETIFIYTGFYTHDMTKFYGRDIKDLSALAPRPSTRIYLGISQEDSLEVKLKEGKEPFQIRLLDREVYAPAFRQYISAYDPARYSDYVFKIDHKKPDIIIEVKPRTRLWQEKGPVDFKPPAVKNVVVFGAGAIGRGLMALNFRRSGYKVFFVDIDEKLVRRLKRSQRYEVVHLRKIPGSRIKDGAPREEYHRHLVDKVTAISQSEIKQIEKWVLSADAICLAVPDDNLSQICTLLGRCLERRVIFGNEAPINIFLATNRLEANKYARRQILKSVSMRSRSLVNKRLGIVETNIEGMTRSGTERERTIGSTRVYGDTFTRFIADEGGFKGPIPEIVGMQLARDIRSNITIEKQKRLFLFGAAYSFVAYLGHLRDYTYIYEAWADPWIKNEAENFLRIASGALAKKYGFDPYQRAVQETYIRDLKNRFANETFKDPLDRAARDPIRKLSFNERFMGLVQLIKDADIEQEGIIALAIAACLKYDNPDDKESARLQSMIEAKGIEEVLKDICRIEPDSRLGRLIIERCRQFKEFGVAYAGLTLVNPRLTKGTTHVVMGFDGVAANTNPILRRSFAYIHWKIMNGIADDDKREPTEADLLKGEIYFNNILGCYFIGDIIEDIIELARINGIGPERLKSAEEYLDEYRQRRNAQIRAILESRPEDLLVPGIKELLVKLKKLNKKRYLLTKAHHERVREIIKNEKVGLHRDFSIIAQVRDLEGKMQMLRQAMADSRLKESNVIFIDDSPWVIREVRKKFPDICIVAIREGVGKNDEKLFNSANFILDNFIPTKNKLSIFFSTKGLTVPKGFRFPKQAAGPVDIRTLQRGQSSIRQADSAA